MRPPLSKEHAAVVEDVINLRETEQAKPIFAAIRASDEPDMPSYGGQAYVTEDGAEILTRKTTSGTACGCGSRIFSNTSSLPKAAG